MTLTPAEISHLKDRHRRIRNAVWHGEMQEPPLPEGLAPGAMAHVEAARANGFSVHRLFNVHQGKEPDLLVLFTAEVPPPDLQGDKTLENAATILKRTMRRPSISFFDFLLASTEPKEGIVGELILPEAYRAIAPVFYEKGILPIRAQDRTLRFEERAAVQAADLIGDLANENPKEPNRANYVLLLMHQYMIECNITDSPTFKIVDKALSENRYDDKTVDALVTRFMDVQVQRIEQHADQVARYLRENLSTQGFTLLNLNEGTHPVLYEELDRSGISYVSAGPRYEHPLRTHFTFSKTMRGVDWFHAIDNLGNIARVLGSRAHLVEQNALPEIVQPAESGRYARIDVQTQQYRVPEGVIDVTLESTRQHDGKQRAELTVRVPRRSAVIDDIAQYMQK